MITNSLGTYYEFGDKLKIVNDYRGELLGKVTFIEYNNSDTDLCVVRDDRGQHFSIRRKNLEYAVSQFDSTHKAIAETLAIADNNVERMKIDQEGKDIVNKPKHYMLFPEKSVEVRDLMKVLANRLESKYTAMFISDYIQMMQYVLRFDQKNGIEDLEKAKWYLDKLIKEDKNESKD